MFLGVLTAILPVFLIIAAGYIAVGTRYVDPATLGGLAGFVLRIALPALIFGALTGAPLADTLNRNYLLAYGGATMVVFGLGFAVTRWLARGSVTESVVQALGMSAANSGFMGFPIATIVVGVGTAAPILAQNMVIENLLVIPLGMVMAEMGLRRPSSLLGLARGIAGSLLRNPLLIAIAIGIACAAFEVRLPAPVAKPITLMGAVAGPIALFVVGGTLAGLPGGGTPAAISRIVAGKLLLHPLAVFSALWLMPGLDPILVAGGTIFAAAPMMSIYPIVGARFGLAGLTATALLVATVASALTVTALVLILGHFGLISL